jgi:hypothetical protein
MKMQGAAAAGLARRAASRESGTWRVCLSAACPACFGASDSPMAVGMNAGIFVLLGVTAVVLVAIGAVGVMLARRARGFEVRLPVAAPASGGEP